MPVQLTAKESDLLAAVIQEMDGIPPVDFEKLKDKVGHKYAKNARAAFVKVWNKLKESEGATEGTDKPKATVKRAGKTATPRKASEGGPKKPRGKATMKEETENTIVKNEHSEEGVEDQDDMSEVDGKSHLLFPLQSQDEKLAPLQVQEKQPAGATNLPVQDEQLVIREDGFPEGTTNETIKAEAEAIGMEEAEYRHAVKHAVLNEVSFQE